MFILLSGYSLATVFFVPVCVSVCLCVWSSCRKAPAPFDTDRMSHDFKLTHFPNQVFAKGQPFFYQTEGKPILEAKVTGLEGAKPTCTAVCGGAVLSVGEVV